MISAAGFLHAGQHRRSVSRGQLQCRAALQANVHIGSLSSNGLRFGVVVARFNELVTKPLLEGVLEGLERHGTIRDEVQVGGNSSHAPHSALHNSIASVAAQEPGCSPVMRLHQCQCPGNAAADALDCIWTLCQLTSLCVLCRYKQCTRACMDERHCMTGINRLCVLGRWRGSLAALRCPLWPRLWPRAGSLTLSLQLELWLVSCLHTSGVDCFPIVILLPCINVKVRSRPCLQAYWCICLSDVCGQGLLLNNMHFHARQTHQ